ncbi:MAG: glycosyltransferase family 2 protein [Bacteroidia bacterium]|nr:glycosyltransferase family 2 protein [Bacteroidia bacterium]
MSSPLVSIVMPCYKAEDTIDYSLKGILNQNYQNWELLIIIDGRNDILLDKVKTSSKNDKRIKIIYSKKNRGVIRTRNIGIRLSNGLWLAFCDADDYWLPNKLTYQIFKAKEENAGIVCSAFCFYYQGINRLDLIQTKKIIDYSVMLKTNAIPMSTAILKVDSYCKHYFPSIPDNFVHEDYAFWLTILQKRSIKVAYISEVTTHILKSRGSRSSNKLLSAKSHAYILSTFTSLPKFKIALMMINYIYNAIYKRYFSRFSLI